MNHFDIIGAIQRDFDEMPIVFRTCDECKNRFEVRQDIAFEMDAWAEQGEPYVCPVCLPSDPHSEETP